MFMMPVCLFADRCLKQTMMSHRLRALMILVHMRREMGGASAIQLMMSIGSV